MMGMDMMHKNSAVAISNAEMNFMQNALGNSSN